MTQPAGFLRAARCALLLGLMGLGACSAPDDPAPGPDGMRAAPSIARGEVLSLACQACHPLDPGQRHRVGPNLSGMFGRDAAALEDFGYSDALARSGLVWTPQTLDAWLAEPNNFVVGTTMAFSGYSDPADRAALIAYLVERTAPSAGDP